MTETLPVIAPTESLATARQNETATATKAARLRAGVRAGRASTGAGVGSDRFMAWPFTTHSGCFVARRIIHCAA